MAASPLLDLRAVTVEFTELLAQARPAERTLPLCLRGDLVAEIERLERELAAQQAAVADSLAGSGTRMLAERIEAVREQMQDSTVVFRVRALSRTRMRELTDAHPPRRGPDGEVLADDRDDDVNTSTFYFALVRACLVEPEMDDDQYARLVDEVLSDRQFEDLSRTAVTVTRGTVDVPFSSAASRILGSGGASSAPND